MTTPSVGDVTTCPDSTTATSLWKMKKSPINSPLKLNLIYYMKKHLTSPTSEAEEE